MNLLTLSGDWCTLYECGAPHTCCHVTYWLPVFKWRKACWLLSASSESRKSTKAVGGYSQLSVWSARYWCKVHSCSLRTETATTKSIQLAAHKRCRIRRSPCWTCNNSCVLQAVNVSDVSSLQSHQVCKLYQPQSEARGSSIQASTHVHNTNHGLKPSVKYRSNQASVSLPPTPKPKTSCAIAYMMTQLLAVVPVATANMTHPMNITTASCIAAATLSSKTQKGSLVFFAMPKYKMCQPTVTVQGL